ncbi:hypothetical protein TR51_16990 [Kitasatospora griseola]|uniref:V-type ATPase subunit n=1 Tax=Kitasatospora griseola TaxID=2064 RepID=A0A0D0NBC0_KITGR|nr:V-type ATPase subunit [Kitasatospora griseola]KIQ65545.1 hypothetical protein TR51_16990 [Kitasatospora griseola]
MGAGWVAGVTRARAMLSRRLGAVATRQMAAAGNLDEALKSLSTTGYRHDLEPGTGLAAAQRSVSATLLWQLRVLAGWLPREGAGAVRLLAAGYEIANIQEHLRVLAGAEPGLYGEYRLGALATAWPRLSGTRSAAALRRALAASAWGDPGGETLAAVAVGLRVSAAARTAAAVPQARFWAAGRVALLVGREVFLLGRRLTDTSARRAARVLGPDAVGAASFADFRRHLPTTARWVVSEVEDAADLWRAEAGWWTRVGVDGGALLRGSRLDASPVVGAVALLSVDAWQVRAALELAARGGGGPLEVFDELV